MNKLLQRQFKKFFGDIDSVPQNLESLLKAISDAYDGFDEDRNLIERALDTSSEELTETNRKLRQEVDERKRAEERLLAVNSLQKLLLPPAPIEQKLEHVTDAVVQILDADFARVWVIRPGDRCNAGCIHAEVTEGPHVCRFRDKCLHLMASSGRYTHLDGKVHRRVPFGCYKIGLVAAGEHDKFLTNEAATDPRVHNHDWVKELGLVSFAGYRLTHTDGTPLGVLALFSKHPISQEEDALLEGIAHSTSMVIRTSQTEEYIKNLNKDLKSTVTRLTQSNRQLNEFAYLAAHDLKTPLRGISTLAQWLVKDYMGKFDDEGRQQVNLLIERVDRMNELINAILQYSTITREPDKEHPIDLNILVGTVLAEISPPVNIKVTVNEYLPIVVCEKTHLRKVFYHLLANAIRFMDKPEGNITIDYTDKDDLLEFRVSDNGPGIAPQHFEKIFQLFQTLDDSDLHGSGGIGLTIVRKVVELYDGRVWLTSELGQGSAFFFTLPKVLSVTDNEKQLLVSAS